MKKIIVKNMVLFFAVFACVFFAKVEFAQAADFSITAPADNSKVGAGDVTIKWNAVSNVKNYDVYVGGEKFTTTSTTYSYYTTKVQAFEACIVANLNDGTQKASNKVKFGVTKKGLGLDKKTNMGTSVNLNDWGCGWYYNWGETPSTTANYDGVEFVPMIWKSTSASDLSSRTTTIKNAGYKYVLTFNEPDLSGQCNMSVDAVYNAWKGLNGFSGIKISSPVTALWPQSSPKWFQTFMTKLTAANKSPDFISIHCYPENYAGSSMANWFVKEVVDWTWEKYHKPIWITEFSTTGNNVTATGGNGTKEFWQTVMPLLDQREYVERYAAFGFDARNNPNVGLWYYSTGAWTQGGEVYRNLGNPDMNSVKLSGVDYSKLNKTPTSGSASKPGKGKISSAKYKKKRKIIVKLKKVANAKGYNIRWCDNKKFDGFEGKHTTKLKYTIKGLDKNTRYYVKARAYNLDASGKKQYGSWSAVKKVKVKK